jgi:formylmethanofuran dehydrogenase subunit B
MQEMDNTPCPFCALLCDDLRIAQNMDGLSVIANGCARSRDLFSAFARARADPLISGKPATFDSALARAAGILRNAKRPLFLSAGTDVAGMRALIDLAERRCGLVDHVDSDAAFRNLIVLQENGWISTTLTEVRNRADLLVIAGNDIARYMPRFFERCFGDAEPMFPPGSREIWAIGEMPEGIPESGPSVNHIPAANERLAEIFLALRSLLAGRDLRAGTIAGIPRERLSTLMARMQAAGYGVLTWAAAGLNFDHAELAVQAMCELVRELNVRTRFSILPVAGPRADVTATQVTTWQTGFPLRIDFTGGSPAYDLPWPSPARHPEERAVDALVSVAAIDGYRIARSRPTPTILLGHPGIPDRDCDVFIPVATPGVHHAGHFYRTDNVVALRVRGLIDSALPSAAHVLLLLSESTEALV